MADVTDPNSPLDPAMIQRLRRGRDMLNHAMVLCQKGMDCGMDLRAENAYCGELAARYDKVFAHFVNERKSR